jgi:hypothetical protein
LAGTGGFAGMAYKFNPPLTLKGDVVVRTLDDAAAFVRSYRCRFRKLGPLTRGHQRIRT